MMRIASQELSLRASIEHKEKDLTQKKQRQQLIMDDNRRDIAALLGSDSMTQLGLRLDRVSE